jgi:hypothetical protein
MEKGPMDDFDFLKRQKDALLLAQSARPAGGVPGDYSLRAEYEREQAAHARATTALDEALSRLAAAAAERDELRTLLKEGRETIYPDEPVGIGVYRRIAGRYMDQLAQANEQLAAAEADREDIRDRFRDACRMLAEAGFTEEPHATGPVQTALARLRAALAELARLRGEREALCAERTGARRRVLQDLDGLLLEERDKLDHAIAANRPEEPTQADLGVVFGLETARRHVADLAGKEGG